jgi:hypothetical protein
MGMDLAVPDVNIANRFARGGLGAFASRSAFDHILAAYRDGMSGSPPFQKSDVATDFGTVRGYRFDGEAGPPIVLLPSAQVEVWPEASHAINGEYPQEIAERVRRFPR